MDDHRVVPILQVSGTPKQDTAPADAVHLSPLAVVPVIYTVKFLNACVSGIVFLEQNPGFGGPPEGVVGFEKKIGPHGSSQEHETGVVSDKDKGRMFLGSVVLGPPFGQILEQWGMDPVRAVDPGWSSGTGISRCPRFRSP